MEPFYNGIIKAYNTPVSATAKENFYWLGIDTAIDAVVRACKIFQKCKIAAVNNKERFP